MQRGRWRDASGRQAEEKGLVDLVPTVLHLRHSLWCLCLPRHSLLPGAQTLTMTLKSQSINHTLCDIILSHTPGQRLSCLRHYPFYIPTTYFTSSPLVLMSTTSNLTSFAQFQTFMHCTASPLHRLKAFH